MFLEEQDILILTQPTHHYAIVLCDATPTLDPDETCLSTSSPSLQVVVGGGIDMKCMTGLHPLHLSPPFFFALVIEILVFSVALGSWFIQSIP